jgi:hypothetical protein
MFDYTGYAGTLLTAGTNAWVTEDMLLSGVRRKSLQDYGNYPRLYIRWLE